MSRASIQVHSRSFTATVKLIPFYLRPFAAVGLCLLAGCRVVGAHGAADEAATHPGMVFLKGGAFTMGSSSGAEDQKPAHPVVLKPFWIDRYPVTVAKFTEFVNATHYRTDAEKFGWSGVFDPETGEWKKVFGASWAHPDGPDSKPNPEEPVTQVSWRDAEAYAAWAHKRLPTEAEYEFAERGGLEGKLYAWGDDLRPGGKYLANWWQGTFPTHDTGADGYAGRSPVGKYPPNGYGLYDMTGNVWEWCGDWYDPSYYSHSPKDDPMGPPTGKERSQRGGSWLCSDNYCQGYRVAARSHSTPDTGLNHVGFRCVQDG